MTSHERQTQIGGGARRIDVRNPRTGEFDHAIEALGPSALGALAARAHTAQGAWSRKSLEERVQTMGDFASALEGHRPRLAEALERDTGRRRIAQMEIGGAIASIHAWRAQAPSLLPGGWTQGRANPAIRHRPQFVPYPLVGVISPWNFPLTLSMIDTIPALLAGCAVIVKPSEITPRFAEPLAEAALAAGLADLLLIAQGDGETGAALIEHADAVCFTGSVATGRKVAMGCAARMIPAFLELGGKDPMIVTASADLERATDAALRGAVLSTGQACQSIERIYVDQAIAEAFTDLLVRKAQSARLNWPDIAQGEIGPIIFERQAAILADHIDDARAKGAQILTGGEIEHHGGGLWLRPTVLSGADHSMKIMREESFGPVAPVMAYSSAEEAIALANDTEYGLSAAVFAGGLDEAEAIALRLEAGAVSLNDAALTSLFHEAEKQSFKLSGLGASRMGASGFQRFMRRKALIANTAAPAPLGAFAEDAGGQ